MPAAARLWAIAVVAGYVVAVLIIGFTALGYERYLDGMAQEAGVLPTLTLWTFHAHRYTPLFFIFCIPAILCAISTTLTAQQRTLAMQISLIGLSMLAVWFGLIWLGMGFVVGKFEAIAS